MFELYGWRSFKPLQTFWYQISSWSKNLREVQTSKERNMLTYSTATVLNANNENRSDVVTILKVWDSFKFKMEASYREVATVGAN